MNKICSCGGTLEFIETPESTHYGKLSCVNCQKWNSWVRNPIKTGRSKTTKCKVHYDFCKICGRDKNKLGFSETLTAHHITPLSEGGLDEIENIIVLCSACHKLVHWARLYMHNHLDKFYKKGDNNGNNDTKTTTG